MREQINRLSIHCSVKNADIRLCVLSLPDLTVPSAGIPKAVADLISPDTLLLLNKSDLMPGGVLTSEKYLSGLNLQRWPVSVTGDNGMVSFMEGLADILHSRCVNYTRIPLTY